MSSIRDNNPVIFIEQKLLYRKKGPVPEDLYTVPLGVADVKRQGDDITIVATGVMVTRSLTAAEKLSQEGIEVEVVDPRTLKPYDAETITNSVIKTGRLLVVHEAYKTCGFGAEISAMISEGPAFMYLNAPIRRLAGLDIPIPYNRTLEYHTVPQEENIVAAARELMAYK